MDPIYENTQVEEKAYEKLQFKASNVDSNVYANYAYDNGGEEKEAPLTKPFTTLTTNITAFCKKWKFIIIGITIAMLAVLFICVIILGVKLNKGNNEIVRDCTSEKCVNGRCKLIDEIPHCQCDEGYKGQDCSEIITCGFLLSPAEGSVSYNNITFQGQATYSCSTGFRLSSGNLRTCQASGIWNGTKSECISTDLNYDGLALSDNGSFVREETLQGVTVTCKVGYTMKVVKMITGPQITCTEIVRDCTSEKCVNGRCKLIDEIPNCQCDEGYKGQDCSEIITCGFLLSPAEGSVSYNNITFQGQATYSCSTGFRLSSGNLRTCQASGIWNGTKSECISTEIIRDCTYVKCVHGMCELIDKKPHCQCDEGYKGLDCNEIITCGILSSPSNGSVSYDNITFQGQAMYNCNTGFRLSSDNLRTCQANGIWNGTESKCISTELNYDGLVLPDNGSLVINKTLQEIIMTCNLGYTMKVVKTISGTQIICTEIIKDCTSVKCVYGICELIDEIPHCQCDEGYKNPDCNESRCIVCYHALNCISCGILSSPADGSVNYNKITFQDQATYSCNTGFKLSSKNIRTCQANGTWNGTKSKCISTALPCDCTEVYKSGLNTSGTYKIYPVDFNNDVHEVIVYCDMLTKGGGWTVFQHRQDGSVLFNRTWADYKKGFGNVTNEFWLGNNIIAVMTNPQQRKYILRIDLEAFNGQKRFAEYTDFSMAPESDNYTLSVGTYNGTAGDSGLSYHNNSMFSTYDQSGGSCSRKSGNGGFWYKQCYHVNLNGVYYHTAVTNNRSINWKAWSDGALRNTTMMFRPMDFP